MPTKENTDGPNMESIPPTKQSTQPTTKPKLTGAWIWLLDLLVLKKLLRRESHEGHRIDSPSATAPSTVCNNAPGYNRAFARP